jgi:predicted NAD/FAD-dependent oxidoreductase
VRRREFIAAMAAAAWAAGCREGATGPRALPPGDLLGASHGTGHRLRARDFPAPATSRDHKVVIIGGGIAGLTAGWRLLKAGVSDFTLLELEADAGGNARHGANAISAYPWGAHYVTLPPPEAVAVRELLADLGAIAGDPLAARPRYEERYLCHDPQERLYRNGLWHEGLLPEIGARDEDRRQYRRFHELMDAYKARRGRGGRKAFAIPVAQSAPDPELIALDRMTMRDFLLANGLDSEPLHWYVSYACRDDFGTELGQTSAWAGVHYFASRDGDAENADSGTVLTWPEGNGWVVRHLSARLGARIVTHAPVHRVRDAGRRVEVDYFDLREGRTVRVRAARAIFAAPVFLVPYLLEDAPATLVAAAREFQYAPWIVANLSLKAVPLAQAAGAALAWDNVIYDGAGLGYVVATHQALRVAPGPTVLTYYLPLSGEPPAKGRERLLAASREAWAEAILADLARPHPEIRDLVTRLDVFRWGHAMVRPVPGFMWGRARAAFAAPSGRLHFAHTDLSGMALFEEAVYWGARAAQDVVRALARQA